MKMLIGSLVTLLVLLFVFCVAFDMDLFADAGSETLVEKGCRDFRIQLGDEYLEKGLCIIDTCGKKYALRKWRARCVDMNGNSCFRLELIEVEECPCQ